ncbi:cation-dependent mannose-6-phosphate receptor isoform X1 [Bombina bombina]|uniref:cation-dependent mannose-6-phosphate receptor isoform X1 n=1 Tax=Bombina bombina TaxID=8345 RepID=UPI00235AA99C|nr:cation-dependent mannose-6-phosphate receptor isoform X1 [Bombina bombina]
MYSWLSYICLAAVSSLAVGEAVINDCQLVGDADKKSTVEQALLQRLAPLKHKRFVTQTQEGTGTYTYTFVVCGRADNDTGSTVGLMQTRTEPKENTAIGRISQTHIMNGSHWIMMIYRGGDKYDNHCGSEERKATIMILCDKSTLADDFTIIREERNKTKECFYLFELSSSVACPPEESHLSVGSILLIV